MRLWDGRKTGIGKRVDGKRFQFGGIWFAEESSSRRLVISRRSTFSYVSVLSLPDACRSAKITDENLVSVHYRLQQSAFRESVWMWSRCWAAQKHQSWRWWMPYENCAVGYNLILIFLTIKMLRLSSSNLRIKLMPLNFLMVNSLFILDIVYQWLVYCIDSCLPLTS